VSEKRTKEEKVSEKLEKFVDSLDNKDGPWRDLRTRPELISEKKHGLCENDQKLLTYGPRAEVLRAAGRGTNHPAVIMVWLK